MSAAGPAAPQQPPVPRQPPVPPGEPAPPQLPELAVLPLAGGARARALRLSLRNRRPVAAELSLGSRVERLAVERPGRAAVSDGQTVLSYRDLDTLAGRIAGWLAGLGCRAGEVVAAAGDRCADTVSIFLALERLGAVYLPVDPQWPAPRVAEVLDRAGARCVLDYRPDPPGVTAPDATPAGPGTTGRLEAAGSPGAAALRATNGTGNGRPVHRLPSGLRAARAASASPAPAAAVDGSSTPPGAASRRPAPAGSGRAGTATGAGPLALTAVGAAAGTDRGREPRYCIFTSGTTGRPKGALVEHRGMLNHLWAKVDDLGLSGSDRVAFTAPLVFDISVWQMLAPLLVGAEVVVVADADLAYPRRLLRRLAGVNVVELVPTVLGWIVAEAERRARPGSRPGRSGAAPLADLRWLISTGEELPPTLAARALAALPHVRLLNAYGPTECSDDVTHHEVTAADTARPRLPVGAPVANADLYLLVDTGSGWRAAEPDEAGELFVGGLVVGLGYVNDPQTTAAAFFADPFAPDSPTGRLYRTGDLARFGDGVVHYLGRTDRQVKVAGVRMELDEIEAVLRRHPAVDQCAVVVSTDGPHPVLAAHFTAGAPVPAAELRDYLAHRLPEAMVPHRMVRLASMPLTANGKTDHRALLRLTTHPGADRMTDSTDTSTPDAGPAPAARATSDTAPGAPAAPAPRAAVPRPGPEETQVADLPPHAQLLLELARPRLDAPRLARVRELAGRADLDWAAFLEASAWHKLLPLVGRHVDRYRLDRRAGDAPAFPYPWVFTTSYLGNRTRNLALADEFGRVFEELGTAGIRHAVRKGFSLGEGEYRDPALRRIADLDILLDRDDAPAAQQVLHRLGYVQGRLAADGERIEPYSRKTQLFWRVNLSNQLPYRKAASRPDVSDFNVDICHDIFQPSSGISAKAGELLARAVPAVLCGAPTWVPAPDDRLLDLCSHLHKEATSLHFIEDKQDLQLSKFLDLALVAGAFSGSAWELFRDRVQEYGAEPIAYYALHFTARLYPEAVPPAVLDALRPEQTDYLELYGAQDGQTARWEQSFLLRLFNSGRHTAGTRSNVPLA